MPSISAIARDWSVSRPYASRCINHLGCPTTSLEAARQWRQENASRRSPTNPRQIAKLLGEDDTDSNLIARREDSSEYKAKAYSPLPIDSLHKAFKAAIVAQERAFGLLVETICVAKIQNGEAAGGAQQGT
jgi:hypothetical protein